MTNYISRDLARRAALDPCNKCWIESKRTPVCDDCKLYGVAQAIDQIPAADVVERASGLIGEIPSLWTSVTKRFPDNNVHVLLACKCGAGSYVCDGFHTEKYSTPTEWYDDIDADYDEETDEYYFPEGWWEVIKNWDDYSCVAIEDTVTHWMPLPDPPREEGE